MDTIYGELLHREEWNGDLVEIVAIDGLRSLFFASRFLQSSMSPDHPEELQLSYTRYMLLGLPALESVEHILLIGIGAGSLIHYCHHHYPESVIDAVDNSPRIIALARRYFMLPDSDRIRIHCADGLAFLEQTAADRRYDLILVDAFDHQGMAENIYSPPFFKKCATVLTDEGMLSCNLWSGEARRLAAIRDSIASCLAGQIFVPVPDRDNAVILAFRQPVPWHRFHRSREEWRELEARFDLDFRAMLKVARRRSRSLLQRLFPVFPWN
jgi:spermidine synthase